jgi:hypothetical protein
MAMREDPFDSVLGRGRGSHDVARDRQPSGLDLARALVQRLDGQRGSVADAAQLELDLGRELGLELCPGRWTLCGEGVEWALTAIYYGGEFVGFWGTDAGACRLLRFDDTWRVR